MRKVLFAFGLLLTVFLMPSCDRCADVACQNGGTCTEGRCNCPFGYEGTLCDKVAISYLAGPYAVSDYCLDTFPSTEVSSFIVVRGTRLSFQPIELFVNAVEANTDSADGNHILIMRQKPDAPANISIEGDGQISFDSNQKAVLNLSYTIVDSSVTPPVTISCAPIFTHK